MLLPLGHQQGWLGNTLSSTVSAEYININKYQNGQKVAQVAQFITSA